jgi:CelD/BcsL family acetyltransferase involved in cellulose biosynthesis
MRIEVWRDGDAWARLERPAFREQWERLYADCPWASVFQSYGYASTWYDIYRPRYAPLLVGATEQDGTLVGLLPLAIGADGQPIVAGGRQAEYHVWMARPAEGDRFIEAALERVGAECPGRTLTFRYLPPNAPRSWLASGRRIAARSLLVPARRGIMEFDQATAEAALRKKGQRERIRKLERYGPVVFERLADPQQIDALLEEIIPLCDLRHGALHDVMPFTDDPLKAAFHRALARVPGVLCVSVLRCGDEVACAAFDADNRGQVALGFAAFSPFLSRHSPRRALITELARDLSRRGYTSIDLTPGEDSFKGERATRYDTAYTLHVFFSRARFVMRTAVDAARGTAKALVRRAGADSGRLRERLGSLTGLLSAGDAGRALQRHVWSDKAVELYRFDCDAVAALPVGGSMERDRISDLAAYRPGVLAPDARQVFLRTAYKRLEHGAHVFTRIDRGRLVACGWVNGTLASDDWKDSDDRFDRPADSSLVHDLRGTESWMQSEELSPNLGQLVREAAIIAGSRQVLVAVPAGQPELRRAVLQLGGNYAGKVIWRTRAGRTQVRSTFAGSDSGTSAPSANSTGPGARLVARPRVETHS